MISPRPKDQHLDMIESRGAAQYLEEIGMSSPTQRHLFRLKKICISPLNSQLSWTIIWVRNFFFFNSVFCLVSQLSSYFATEKGVENCKKQFRFFLPQNLIKKEKKKVGKNERLKMKHEGTDFIRFEAGTLTRKRRQSSIQQ